MGGVGTLGMESLDLSVFIICRNAASNSQLVLVTLPVCEVLQVVCRSNFPAGAKENGALGNNFQVQKTSCTTLDYFRFANTHIEQGRAKSKQIQI